MVSSICQQQQQDTFPTTIPSLWDPVIKSQALERILSSHQDATHKLRRKRVRFDEDGDEQSPKRIKVRVLNDTAAHASTTFTKEERESAWYEKGYLRETVRTSKLIATAIALQSSTDFEVKNYSEALASTYASCSIESSLEDSNVTERYAQHLALVSNIDHVSIHGQSARGLEKVAVPMVGREALRRRKDVISNVLLAQKTIGQYSPSLNQKQEIIRRISEEKSRCARMFAKSLGTSDAVSAFMEYGSSPRMAEDEKPLKVSDTPYKSNFGSLSLLNGQNSMAA